METGQMPVLRWLAHLPCSTKGALLCGRMNFSVRRSELCDLSEEEAFCIGYLKQTRD